MFGPFSPLQDHRQQYGHQFDRAQQVNELLVAQPLCRAVNPDRSLLEVGVQLTDGTLTSLRISLPRGFPSDRPALSITSPVRHPWVDGIGRLSFPLLDRWGASHIRLAAVVADAFKGLGGTAASLPSQASGSTPLLRPQQQQHQQAIAAPPPPPSQQQAADARLPAASGSGEARLPPMPSIPSSFPEVDAMSDAELGRVLTDACAYQQLVDQIAQRLKLFQVVDDVNLANRELATANLAAGEEQADKRNQLAIIRSSEYSPAKTAFDEKWARQQAVLEKLSPEVLMRRLQEGVKSAEEEAEGLVQQLASGAVSVDAFVQRYTQAQATFHQRDLKLQAAQQTLPQLGG